MAPIKSNNPYASYFDFFSKSGIDAATPAPGPFVATGGIISDYGNYRAHIFTSSGALTVTEGSTTADILIVGVAAVVDMIVVVAEAVVPLLN